MDRFLSGGLNSVPYSEMPTFKNQKQYSEREKTVFWQKKKYFVKNNEKHIWGEKEYHEREAQSPFGQGLGPT